MFMVALSSKQYIFDLNTASSILLIGFDFTKWMWMLNLKSLGEKQQQKPNHIQTALIIFIKTQPSSWCMNSKTM